MPHEVKFVLEEIRREYDFNINWKVLKKKLSDNYYKERLRRVEEEEIRISNAEELRREEETKFRSFEEEVLRSLEDKEIKNWERGARELRYLAHEKLRILKDERLCRKERTHLIKYRFHGVENEKSQILEERKRILNLLEQESLKIKKS